MQLLNLLKLTALIFGSTALFSPSFGQAPNYIPKNGLEGYYSFSGDVADSSNNGNNGSIIGNVKASTDRNGLSNSAFEFSGKAQYIDFGDVNSFEGTNQLSYSVWFNAYDLGGTIWKQSQPILSKWFSTTSIEKGSWNFVIFQDSMYFTFGDGVNSENIIKEITFSTNEWVHVVCTYNEGLTNIYLNGQLIHSSQLTITSLHNSAENFSIGDWYHDNDTSYSTFKGKIDDVAIWSRSLTDCEIQDLFNARLNSITRVTQLKTELTANQADAMYQWLDCDFKYDTINGETSQTLYTPFTGNYAVEVTFNGCVDTSECYFVDDYTSINDATPSMPEVIRIVDLMDRSTIPQNNKFLIYIYSDGKTEKVIQLDR